MKSESVIIDKLSEFKKLNQICDLIKEKASTMKLADRLLVDGKVILIPPVIFRVLFASNPIYDIDMKCDDKDELVGIRLKCDYDFDRVLERLINSNYDFKKANRKLDEYTVMEDIITILNSNIRRRLLDQPTLLIPEIETYLDQIMPLLKNCMDTIELLAFHKKGTIMRILKENYRFAREIKSFYDKKDELLEHKESKSNTESKTILKGEWF